MRLFSFIAATALAMLLSGCGLVYKMEINQGNYITQDMVAKLKEGQTRQQARLVLGTPTTESIFHKDRWDYVYSLERRGRPITSHKLTVLFVDDKVKSWTDVNLPTSPVVDRDPAYANLEKDKRSDEGGASWWSKLGDWWRK
ncbi:MAG: outer membrane protein assembly factor BamE [Casimicrobium sp.]|jgi:outer membrane protein assembly factor BamE